MGTDMTTWSYRPGSAGDVLGALSEAVDEAATLGGEAILTVARRRVPIEDGILETSGAVSAPERGRASISFDTPYAVRQHEELGYRHDDGRQAKYLESAMHDEADTVAQIAATVIRTRLGT
jgi:hypothetical protein